MTITEIYDGIARGGLPFLLTLIGYAGYRRWWVFGWVYDQEARRADRFESLALRSLHIADVATDAAATAATVARDGRA